MPATQTRGRFIKYQKKTRRGLSQRQALHEWTSKTKVQKDAWIKIFDRVEKTEQKIRHNRVEGNRHTTNFENRAATLLEVTVHFSTSLQITTWPSSTTVRPFVD